MLERKRILVQKDIVKKPSKDHPLIIYEHAKTGEIFAITDPGLTLNNIKAVQEEVTQILETERVG